MTYLWFLSLFLNGTFLGWVFAFLSADLRGFPQTESGTRPVQTEHTPYVDAVLP